VLTGAAAPVMAEAPVIDMKFDCFSLPENPTKSDFPKTVSPTIERSGNIWTPPQLS